MCPLITNIQKYSIHDGPGIRTTVFFKGCPLRCRWCHNPETQSFENETWNDGEAVASEKTVEELMEQLLRDRIFYEESGGGVTLSGGEVMAQDMDFVSELLERIRHEAIPVLIDTCGAVPYERFEKVIDKVDGFLYDVKLMDSAIHEEYTGCGNEEILDNLRHLSRDGAKLDIRIPVIAGLSGTKENIEATTSFLKDNDIRCRGITLLSYHGTGSGKYERLGREYEGRELAAPSAEEMEILTDLTREDRYLWKNEG